MSDVWPHASPQNPCPICTKTDWCQFGDRAMLCKRVESKHAHPAGGWFHFYGTSNPEWVPRRRFAPPPRRIDARRLMSQFSSPRAGDAERLGVTPGSFELLDVAWSERHAALAFPMKDGREQQIGIRLRNWDGFKWAVPGSRNGLFVPNYWDGDFDCVFLPEGPTDTAALLSIGLFAVGRPNVLTGAEFINETVERLRVKRAVVVADNDDMKRLGDREGRPGIEGALRLKKDLRVKSVIWIPPSPLKDAREFVRRGGTAQMVESDIRNKLWTR